MVTHRSLVAGCLALADSGRLGPGTVFAGALPLHHHAGLLDDDELTGEWRALLEEYGEV